MNDQKSKGAGAEALAVDPAQAGAKSLADPADGRTRVYTLLGVALAMFLGALDQTIVSTAMPRIVDRLSGLDRYTWVTTVYLLVSTILVPVYGKLADLVNRKALQLWSVAVFLAGSFLCGLAGEFGSLPLLGDGMGQLIAFRGVQAVGGAGIFALALIIVADLYPPRERGKISGVFGSVFGLASVVGPLVGGFLTDHAGSWLAGVDGWRWVFYVNLPVGALALAFIIAKMPRMEPHDSSRRLNVASALLMVLAFTPIILALQLDKTQYPWSSPRVLGLSGGGLLMLLLWIGHSSRARHPILDLKLFSNRVFLTSNLAALLYGAGFMAVIIFLPLYMVNVQGVSATQAGASVIPLSVGMVLSAGLSGFAVTKAGRYKAMLVLGSGIALAGVALMALLLSAESPYWLVVALMVFVGLGFGPSQSLYSLAVQNAVPPAEVGQSTSASQFTRQIGSTVGAALLGAVFSAALSSAFAANLPGAASLGGTTGTGGPPAEAHKGASHALNRGLSEIKEDLAAGFDASYARVDALFALRGTEAEAALASLKSDSALPPEFKDRLKDGTPAMKIDASIAWLGASLEKALMSGDRRSLEAVLSDPRAAPLLDPARKAELLALAAAPPAARSKALEAIRAGLSRAEDAAIEAANAAILPAIKSSIEAAKTKLTAELVSGMRKSFASAIHRVWISASFIMVLMFLFTLLVPNLPLRGRGEGAPSTEAPPA